MKNRFLNPAVLLVALPLLSVGAFAADTPAAGGAQTLTPDQLKWGDGPPNLPKGAKMAVLQGDPTKDGPFTLRLRFPANYRIAPHTHPADYTVTILSGSPSMGLGEKVDAKATHALKPGAFHYLPAKTAHYWVMKKGTEFQVQGTGPFGMTYIRPEDDPQKGAAAKQ